VPLLKSMPVPPDAAFGRSTGKGRLAVSYVVNWQAGEGAASWHAAAELTDAAAHVEHLRNREGVEQAKIYRLEEVAFELRPYFRVELADGVTAPPREPAHAASVVAAEDLDDDDDWAEVAPVDIGDDMGADDALEGAAEGTNGTHRRGLFGR
jgi:hypothetical protein